MQRSKFPYTARSSAKVIRHAVSIDERRAKFRSDLISEGQSTKPDHHQHHHHRGREQNQKQIPKGNGDPISRDNVQSEPTDRFRRPSQARPMRDTTKSLNGRFSREEGHLKPRMSSAAVDQQRSVSPTNLYNIQDGDASSTHTNTSQLSVAPPRPPEDEDDIDEAANQDIEELWFPGCHADLGGGWPLAPGEDSALSHGPLVWIVTEAQRAGLEFDREMMIKLKCCDQNSGFSGSYNDTLARNSSIPKVQVTSSPNSNFFGSPRSEKQEPGWASGLAPDKPQQSEFHRILHGAATKGNLHDCLEFNNGLSIPSVLSWKFMEYMPFRRMDLQPDGSWKAISFP